MRGESRVEIAVLILLTAAYYSEYESNSELIGEAAGCSPVIIRRIYKQLKEAGLLDTKPGRYGLRLAKDKKEITLLEIVQAVQNLSPKTLFGIDAPLSGTTPIKENLFEVLNHECEKSIANLKNSLSTITLDKFAESMRPTYGISQEEKRTELKEYMAEAEKRHLKK